MGFFKNLTKSLNPVSLIKNPKQAVSYAFDPAGTAVRAGRGTDSLTLRGGLDPSGQLLQGQPQQAQSSYQPQPARQLSPGAQQLYDQMKARTAARTAARAQPAAPAPGIGDPRGGMRIPGTPGSSTRYADGGKVADDSNPNFASKAFDRKPNGKPC